MGVLEDYKSVLIKLADAHNNHTQLLQKRSNSSAVLSNIQNELQKLKTTEKLQTEEYINSLYQRAKNKYAPILVEIERLRTEQTQLLTQANEKINSYDITSFKEYFNADFEILELSSVSIYLLYAIQQFYGVGCSQVLGPLEMGHFSKLTPNNSNTKEPVSAENVEDNFEDDPKAHTEEHTKESTATDKNVENETKNKEENTTIIGSNSDESTTVEHLSDSPNTQPQDTSLKQLQSLIEDVKVFGAKDISQLVDEVVGRNSEGNDPLHFEALETTYEAIDYERSVKLLSNLADNLGNNKISKDIYDLYLQCLRYASQSSEVSGLRNTTWDKMQTGVKVLGKFLETQQSRFKWKYTIHAGVIGASILLLCTYPMVLVTLAGGVIAAISYANHKRTSFIKSLDDYSEYIVAYMSLKTFLADQFDVEYNAYCDALQEKAHQLCNEAELLIQNYNNQYHKGVADVTVDNTQIATTVHTKLQAQYDTLNTRMQSATENVTILDDDIRKSDMLLAELQQEVQAAKQNVKSTYWDLKQVGTSKLFPTSFVIGFSGNELITLDYMMAPMTFIYTGQSSRGNSTLITMIIAQILCNIAPTLVYITLVDTQFGCADYKPLAPLDDKMDIFEYITLNKDSKNFLERTHTEVTMQERLILPHADNITEFNKIKIQRNSFTTEYHVVIFQDLEKSILESEEFIQILRNGPRVGVIPIVFISNTYVREIKQSTQNDEKRWLKILLEESRQSTWTFNQSTLDVEADTGAVWFPVRK